MNYKIIEATSPTQLQKEVRCLLSLGWIPLGGMVVKSEYVTHTPSSVATSHLYYQTLILKIDDTCEIDPDADTEDQVGFDEDR